MMFQWPHKQAEIGDFPTAAPEFLGINGFQGSQVRSLKQLQHLLVLHHTYTRFRKRNLQLISIFFSPFSLQDSGDCWD